MTKKPQDNATNQKPPQASPASEQPKKKKLSLDVNDVSEALERKISP